jgi:thiol-disulfide isomerase/thioredoxin
MIEIDDNYDSVIKDEFEKGNIVVLQFTSEFCEPCFALEIELEELEEKRDDVTVLSIDCNENENITELYDVYQTPTMVIFNKQKEIIYNDIGVILCNDILQIIDANINS